MSGRLHISDIRGGSKMRDMQHSGRVGDCVIIQKDDAAHAEAARDPTRPHEPS